MDHQKCIRTYDAPCKYMLKWLKRFHYMQQFMASAFTEWVKTLQLNLRCPFYHAFTTNINVLVLQGKTMILPVIAIRVR